KYRYFYHRRKRRSRAVLHQRHQRGSQGRDADTQKCLSARRACVHGFPDPQRKRGAPHHSVIPRQWLGRGALSHAIRRQARHGAALRSQGIFRLIETEGTRTCSLVPIMATALVNCPERKNYNLSSLTRIVIGGAASSPTLIREVEEAFGCECVSGYGLTETSPTLSLSLMKADMEWAGEQRYIGQAMTGYPVPGVEMRIVDANDRDVPADGQSIGDIVVRGDGVMEGYWRQ